MGENTLKHSFVSNLNKRFYVFMANIFWNYLFYIEFYLGHTNNKALIF